jgi:hypothetical protein
MVNTGMPYTYLIGWSNINKWYYGVRFAKNCNPDDLWVKYFTSSKQVKMYREEYGEPNIIQIRKTFNSTSLARNWETRVIKKINAVLDESWLNKTDNTDKFFHEGLRGEQTQEHRNKLSQAKIGNSNRRGKKFSPEAIEKLKLARNNRTDLPFLGKKHSEEAKEKMSLARLNNPNKTIQAQIAGKKSAEKRKNNPTYNVEQSKRMKDWWDYRKAIGN